MLYAEANGVKIEATPHNTAICPCCKSDVISKCGSFKTWHWAHKYAGICDIWKEQETEWHRNWKLVFGKENTEIIIQKNDQKHIADILTTQGTVIELQNSPISIDIIKEREEFYGSKMIWIINGKKFEDNFTTRPMNSLEFDDYSPNFDYFARMHGFTPNYKPKEKQVDLRYKWKRPKRCWSQSNCSLYLDFGRSHLFKITEGAGDSHGKGHEITKLEFVKSHNGNETLIKKIIPDLYDNR